ncbi:MAG TPA: hypothetical protein PLB62_08410, partial [Candidatus Sumerlaeota bacterium]|nr:hypothetical protein [Candidatus Sumerlaeota bacterium]
MKVAARHFNSLFQIIETVPKHHLPAIKIKVGYNCDNRIDIVYTRLEAHLGNIAGVINNLHKRNGLIGISRILKFEVHGALPFYCRIPGLLGFRGESEIIRFLFAMDFAFHLNAAQVERGAGRGNGKRIVLSKKDFDFQRRLFRLRQIVMTNVQQRIS